MGYGEVQLPEIQRPTTSWWASIPSDIIRKLDYPRPVIIDGLRGLSVALHTVSCLGLMIDPRDLGRRLVDPLEPTSQIEIENGLGEKSKFAINSLSKNNQAFIRSIKRSYDNFVKNKNESSRMLERLNLNSSKSTVLRALTKLANYNLAAQTHTEWIANLLIKTEDLDVKLAALNA